MLTTCHVVDKNGMRLIREDDIGKIAGFYLIGQSYGDLMCMMPVVHKVCRELGRKLDVWTLRPELFKNDGEVGEVLLCDPVRMQAYVNGGRILIMCPLHVKGQTSQADMNLVDFAAMNVTDLSDDEKHIGLYADESDCVRAQEFLKPFAGMKTVVIHPNKNFPIRTWPEERWYKLAERLLADGYAVIAVGHDMKNLGDAADGTDKTMAPFMLDHPHFLSVINQTTIHEVLELIRRTTLVITVDSGILHIANCTEVPIVGIFTEIKPELRMRVRDGRVGDNTEAVYAPCEYQFCSTHFGMRDNQCKFSDERYLSCLPSVDHVYDAAIRVLESSGNSTLRVL